jgi:hypothetical protein
MTTQDKNMAVSKPESGLIQCLIRVFHCIRFSPITCVTCNNYKVANDTFLIHERFNKSRICQFVIFINLKKVAFPTLDYSNVTMEDVSVSSSLSFDNDFYGFKLNLEVGTIENFSVLISLSNENDINDNNVSSLLTILSIPSMQRNVSVTLPIDLLREVDKKREDVSRSRYFQRALESSLKERGK